MEIWEAFQHTGWVGKAVLGILLAFSLFSWATMIIVSMRFRRTSSASRHFHAIFRKSRRLVDVQNASGQFRQSPLVGLFKAGYAEVEAQVQIETAAGHDAKIRSLESVARALKRAARVEIARLQRNLPFLATTAAATPFIGLFGTVWGIMEAFQSIAATGSTSILAVAPGIAEALINTAAGLFAAIPALIAYNHFIQKLRDSRGEMEDFSLEFLNLTERNFG